GDARLDLFVGEREQTGRERLLSRNEIEGVVAGWQREIAADIPEGQIVDRFEPIDIEIERDVAVERVDEDHATIVWRTDAEQRAAIAGSRRRRLGRSARDRCGVLRQRSGDRDKGERQRRYNSRETRANRHRGPSRLSSSGLRNRSSASTIAGVARGWKTSGSASQSPTRSAGTRP